MRISNEEKEAIVTSILKVAGLPHSSIKIFLYGSRTDDTLQGGDIDLLVLFDLDADLEAFRKKLHYALAEMKSHPAIGDQRIDLNAILNSQIDEPFYQSALKRAILLRITSN